MVSDQPKRILLVSVLQVSTARESLDDHSQLAGPRFGRGLTGDLETDAPVDVPEEPAFQMPMSKV